MMQFHWIEPWWSVTPDKDIMVQIQEIKGIASKLKNLGFPLSEEYQAIAILIALPQDWSTLQMIILNKSGQLTLQETVDSIVEHETTLRQQQENVMFVQNRPKSKSPLPPHTKSKNAEKVICVNCKKEGHAITRCWAEGGGAEGKGPRWSKSKLDLKGKQKETSANVTTGDQSLSPLLTIYILHTDEDALISRDTPTPSNVAHFIMDSGASVHMCPDHSYFSSYQKIDPLRHIWVADNCTIEVISVGDIKV